MHISAQFAAEDVVTEDEKSRVHQTGPHTGTFFNSFHVTANPVRKEDESMDFSEAYVKALAEFLEQEPRAAEGKAFEIRIIA